MAIRLKFLSSKIVFFVFLVFKSVFERVFLYLCKLIGNKQQTK